MNKTLYSLINLRIREIILMLLILLVFYQPSNSQSLRNMKIDSYKYIVIDEISGSHTRESRKYLVKNLQKAGYRIINLTNPLKTDNEFPSDLKSNKNLALYMVAEVVSYNCFEVKINIYNYQNQLLLVLNGSSCGLLSNAIKKSISKLTSYDYSYDSKISNEMDKDIFGNTQSKKQQHKISDWIGVGTGFFVSKNGYIATCYHVVRDVNEIKVEFKFDSLNLVFNATLHSFDSINDLAILKIIDFKLNLISEIPYIIISETLDLGTAVFSLGFPLSQIMGTDIKFTDGKISSRTGMTGKISNYQISVPIQPGNSGGPLFDLNGNIVGITSSGFNRQFNITENVNYAIKSNYLINLIDLLPIEKEILNKINKNHFETDMSILIKNRTNYVVLIKTR